MNEQEAKEFVENTRKGVIWLFFMSGVLLMGCLTYSFYISQGPVTLMMIMGMITGAILTTALFLNSTVK